MIPHSEWKWFGYGGHFIGNAECAYHLSTLIGARHISTIGHYKPRGETEKRMLPIGSGENSFFETFVFASAGVMPGGDPDNGDILETKRYGTSLEAEAGHHEFCKRYAINQDAHMEENPNG